MTRQMIAILLGIVVVLMIFVYTALLPEDSEPRPAPTVTQGSQAGGTTPGASPGANGGGDASAGKELATSLGCVACHSADGSALTGPTWKALYGHEVRLTDGSTITADDAYIRESIANPAVKVVEGFQPIMPSYQGQVDDQQIASIIAYIKTLE